MVTRTYRHHRFERALLFISGGVESLPAIARARQLGLEIVVSDGSPDAPGCGCADHVLTASTYDVEGTIEAARRFEASVRPFDGVICVAADVPLTTAAVADALGLPGIPIESARIASDKLLMKERFAADGVPIPAFAAVGSASDIRRLFVDWTPPIVVKPVDSRGARGVLLLRGSEDFSWAYATARDQSPTQRVMAEQYLAGPQISTESLVIGGNVLTPGFADRNYEMLDRFAPHIIENGADLPTLMDAAAQRKVRDAVARAARSMGIVDGVVKGDMVITDGEAKVIEVAARLSGGYLCTHMIPLSTGVDFVGMAIRQALGDPIDRSELLPSLSQGVAQRWLFPQPGRVLRVDGVDEVAARPEIAFCEIRLRAGEKVPLIESHVSRAGMVLATADTRAAAIAAAEGGVRDIVIEVEPYQ